MFMKYALLEQGVSELEKITGLKLDEIIRAAKWGGWYVRVANNMYPIELASNLTKMVAENEALEFPTEYAAEFVGFKEEAKNV